MKPGQHLGTNVMRRRKSVGSSPLQSDLKRLAALAYHRLESSEDFVRSFARFRRIDYPDLDRLQKLYEWLFVPITLWPFNVEGLFRAALKRASAGKRLDKSMALVVDLLPPCQVRKRVALFPSTNTRCSTGITSR
ncbi:MAG: hypothetical protein DME60_10160 [Verrucomicrobia bacterium]|nr:MAG: hypothetical protein DME60_10160 [Verrucomicrobiota bacterium]